MPATSISSLQRVEQHNALPLADHSAPGALHDDRTLREIFDSQPVWRDFSEKSFAASVSRPKGLFQNRYLTSPDGFHTFAMDSIEKSQDILQKILSASTVEEYESVVRDMDRLSDTLCHVLDLAEFVRVTHPESEWQEAANQTHGMMYEYMNVLNTTSGLNDQLTKALENREVTKCWTKVEMVVGKILQSDFAKSAINLPAAEKERFIDMSSEISQGGAEFVDNMVPAKPYVVRESGRWRGLDPLLARRLTRWGRVWMPSTGPETTQALQQVEDESIRKELYTSNRTAPKAQIHRLEDFLRRRAELARLAGYESHGHKELESKMAQSPEYVETFLQALIADNKPRVQVQMERLLQAKRTIHPSATTLHPWDRDFYLTRLHHLSRSRSRDADFLPAYFSVGTVIQGLSRLTQRLYGIRFVPQATTPGETWDPSVRRLDIHSDTDGHIAVMYCDLFQRAGKSPNPAHYTLRCSRRLSASELSQPVRPSCAHLFASAAEAATDGMASARLPSDPTALYQLPTIALICDFPLSSPTLLTFRDVQTLFHEAGHAIHSMLGRTALQNVSGTRCATDFAELPSVLMEYFASDPSVLALFARHWATNAPLPRHLLATRLALDALREPLDTEHQLLLALLDQQYHSPAALSPAFNSTALYHALHASHAALGPDPPSTSPQGSFGHLFGYGATYYSYLFDRAIAGRVWKTVFNAGRDGGALSRVAGETLKQEVLAWGGARHGWECVAAVLADESLKNGGKAAMAEVGRWGIRD